MSLYYRNYLLIATITSIKFNEKAIKNEFDKMDSVVSRKSTSNQNSTKKKKTDRNRKAVAGYVAAKCLL